MWLLHCRSLHTCNWQRCLQALLLGTPLIMVQIWPSLDRGTCKVPSLSHTKAYAQLLPMSISRVSFLTTSSRERRHASCGCAHMTVSPNAISPSMVLPGTIKRYTISCWGFSASPHTPMQERAKSSDQVASLTWNHNRGDRYHEIPIAFGSTPPIGWGL